MKSIKNKKTCGTDDITCMGNMEQHVMYEKLLAIAFSVYVNNS